MSEQPQLLYCLRNKGAYSMGNGALTAVENILARLVAMPTHTDDREANEQALDYIEHYLVERGLHAERFQFGGHGALVASTKPDNAKEPNVLLAGHTDVVPGGESAPELRLAGGRLT